MGYGQVLPDKKRMSNGSRGGEADHAVDESRGVLGELGNRQMQPIEPIRMPEYAAADDKEDGENDMGERWRDEASALSDATLSEARGAGCGGVGAASAAAVGEQSSVGEAVGVVTPMGSVAGGAGAKRSRGETSGEAEAVQGEGQCEGTIKRKKKRAKQASGQKRQHEAKRVAWAERR